MQTKTKKQTKNELYTFTKNIQSIKVHIHFILKILSFAYCVWWMILYTCLFCDKFGCHGNINEIKRIWTKQLTETLESWFLQIRWIPCWSKHLYHSQYSIKISLVLKYMFTLYKRIIFQFIIYFHFVKGEISENLINNIWAIFV